MIQALLAFIILHYRVRWSFSSDRRIQIVQSVDQMKRINERDSGGWWMLEEPESFLNQVSCRLKISIINEKIIIDIVNLYSIYLEGVIIVLYVLIVEFKRFYFKKQLLKHPPWIFITIIEGRTFL